MTGAGHSAWHMSGTQYLPSWSSSYSILSVFPTSSQLASLEVVFTPYKVCMTSLKAPPPSGGDGGQGPLVADEASGSQVVARYGQPGGQAFPRSSF